MYLFVLPRIKHISIFPCTIFWWLICFLLSIVNGYSVNETFLIEKQKSSHHNARYSIDDLLNGKFVFKVSDDIDMDPCKSSE